MSSDKKLEWLGRRALHGVRSNAKTGVFLLAPVAI